VLETVIQLSAKVMPVIGIMVLVVCAFTNSFIVLLRRQSDDYFQEEFGPPGSEDPVALDLSSQNDFSDIFRAFTDVWFFIYGFLDPIKQGPAGDDTTAIILTVLFSFVTVLIFFNMVM
jgi:hypothetical protein